MFAVIRRYTGASPLIEELQRRRGEVEGVMRAVSGFVAYYAVRAGDELISVTVCEDASGAEESTRRAAGWIKENLPSARIGTPEVTEGEVFLQFQQTARVGT